MKLLLFDIDGTLIRGRGAGRRSLGRAFAQVFGVADIEAAMDRVEFNGRTDPQIIEGVATAAGIPDAHLHPRLDELTASYLEHLRGLAGEPGGAHPCPGYPELLDRLVDRPGIALGLLTGNIEPGARIKLEPFGMNRYFADGGYGSDHAERPTIAAIARKKFEARLGHAFAPEDVVVIGDTVHDVTCGRQNGFRTVAVGTGGVAEATLRAAAADSYFHDFSDVAAVLQLLEAEFSIPV